MSAIANGAPSTLCGDWLWRATRDTVVNAVRSQRRLVCPSSRENSTKLGSHASFAFDSAWHLLSSSSSILLNYNLSARPSSFCLAYVSPLYALFSSFNVSLAGSLSLVHTVSYCVTPSDKAVPIIPSCAYWSFFRFAARTQIDVFLSPTGASLYQRRPIGERCAYPCYMYSIQ
ncbi:hypothetical protein BDQ12DRAFT_348865 [Crucibulum laeve]|uniref:Uncharacterized protein n=1 Tax=Crucibulum laeve TaxID=68775 RepID=A0A5C3MDL4_9AGAR|nr:hypothetical protein BDQ12DRAFT_348865 [Crucibulum laeve]